MEGESKGKMRFGFKKLVRAVSPLIRSISSSKQRPPSVVDENDADQYNWDLSNVDLKTALKLFYRQYNPEKSFIVGEIVQKYAGDEILLLQQLCERYKLSQEDMQEYLDQAPSKDQLFDEKLKNQFNRDSDQSKSSEKPGKNSRSSSPATKESNSRSSSRNRQSRDRDDESVYSTLSKDTGSTVQRYQRKPSFSNYNHPESLRDFEEKDTDSRYSSPQSIAHEKQKFQNYYWDLTDIDVAKALKLLYQELNPKKSPNLAVLDHKTNKEILHLLRQLCKRHCLTESEMGVYLQKAKKSRSSSTNSLPLVTSSDLDEDADLLALESSPVTKPKEINRSSNVSNKPPPPPPPPKTSTTTTSNTNTTSTTNTTLSQHTYAPFSHTEYLGADNDYSEVGGESTEADDTSSGNRFSVEHLKPKLPNGKKFSLGPLVREIRGIVPLQDPVTMPSSFQTPTSNNDNHPTTAKPKQLLVPNNPSLNNANKQFSLSSTVTSTPTGNPPPPPPPQSSNNNLGSVNPELEFFRAELAGAKEQIAEMSKENALVLSLLKQSNFNHLTNSVPNTSNRPTSTNISSLFPTIGLLPTNPNSSAATSVVDVRREDRGIQTEEMAMKQELNKMKAQIAVLEEKLKTFVTENDSLQAEKDFLSRQLDQWQSLAEDLKGDKEDILQLFNILATAPLPAKNVLETYLNKFAPKELSTQAADGHLLTLGERIDALLRTKRQQRKAAQKKQENASGRKPLEITEDDITFKQARAALTNRKEGNASSNNSVNNNNSNSIRSPDFQRLEARDLSSDLKQYSNDNSEDDEEEDNDRRNINPFSPQSKTREDNNPATATTVVSPRSATKTLSLDQLHLKQHDQLQEQYELAKKYYQTQQQQAKLSEKLQQATLAYQETETMRVMKEAAEGKQPLSSLSSPITSTAPTTTSNTSNKKKLANSGPRTASPQRLPATNTSTSNNSNNNVVSTPMAAASEESKGNNPATTGSNRKEWIECFDPKSQRKYYYNTILKKSTWKNPFAQQPTPTANISTVPSSSSNSTTTSDPLPNNSQVSSRPGENRSNRSENRSPTREEPATVVAAATASVEKQYDFNGYPINNGSASNSRPSSAPPGTRLASRSPFLKNYMNTTQSVASSASPPRSMSSSRSQESSKKAEEIWVTAVDPKTGRKYWYNR